MQKPTIGRIVTYNTTEKEREAIKTLSLGNDQKKLPAVIVAAWGDTPASAVNLKVMIDGRGEFWKTSICVADEPDQEGRWEWPIIK